MDSTTLKLARVFASLPVPQEKPQGIRRIFDNSQLIERFDKWLQVIGKRPLTRVSYRFTARDFAKFLVDKPLTATTKDDVRAYLATLYGRGMAPSTSQTRLHALRVLFDFLTLGGQTLTSVPRFIRPRKLPSRLPKALKKDELERFLGAAKEEPRDLAIAELFYAAGLRISEIAALRLEDVHFHAKRLIVRDGKGGKDRVTYFGSPASKALRAYLGDRTSGRVFQPTPREQHGGVTSNGTSYWGQWRETDSNGERVMRSARLGAFRPRKRNAMITQAVELRQAGRKWREVFALLFPGVTLTRKEKMRFWSATSQRLKHAKPDLPIITREAAAEEVRELCEDIPKKEPDPERGLTTRQIARIVLKIAKRAGVDDLNPHRLRHTFATNLLDAGADVMAVKELLGHESVSTTAKYLHVAISNLINTHAKFHPRG